jgi:uncharacterized protein YqgC (DUF456 family)
MNKFSIILNICLMIISLIGIVIPINSDTQSIFIGLFLFECYMLISKLNNKKEK